MEANTDETRETRETSEMDLDSPPLFSTFEPAIPPSRSVLPSTSAGSSFSDAHVVGLNDANDGNLNERTSERGPEYGRAARNSERGAQWEADSRGPSTIGRSGSGSGSFSAHTSVATEQYHGLQNASADRTAEDNNARNNHIDGPDDFVRQRQQGGFLRPLSHCTERSPGTSSSSRQVHTSSHSSQHTITRDDLSKRLHESDTAYDASIVNSASILRAGPPPPLKLEQYQTASSPFVRPRRAVSASRTLPHLTQDREDNDELLRHLPLPSSHVTPSPPSRLQSSLGSLSRWSSHIRPITIHPLSASRAHPYTARPSPYNIPLPSSSRPSLSRMSNTSAPLVGSSSHTTSTPSTPSRRRTSVSSGREAGDASPSSRLASPTGPMSLSKRRAAPAWPASPRRDESTPSHRELTARSAGLPPLGYSQTPIALKVPPTAQWSPAFHRSGYSGHHGQIRQRQHYHPGSHTANPLRRGVSSSAPMSSSPRIPDQPYSKIHPRAQNAHTLPRPPSPCQVVATGKGTYRYKNVSVAWVQQELHRHAPNVWSSPESSDCKIVIPAWNPKRRTADAQIQAPDSAFSVHSNQPGHSYWPPTPIGTFQPKSYESGIARGAENVVSDFQIQRGRRGSLPEQTQVPVIEFNLHQDYLITQSKLLRLVLSSSASQSLDLPVSRPAVLNAEPEGRSPSDSLHKGAKLLSAPTSDSPVVYVPLPDPESFGLVLHWLYWGDACVIEDALSRGLVSWQGLVHNIDYLDLDDPIKRTVGKWWRKWVKTEAQARGGQQDEDDDIENDNGGNDADAELDLDGESPVVRAPGVSRGATTGALNELELGHGLEADMNGMNGQDQDESGLDEAMIALRGL